MNNFLNIIPEHIILYGIGVMVLLFLLKLIIYSSAISINVSRKNQFLKYFPRCIQILCFLVIGFISFAIVSAFIYLFLRIINFYNFANMPSAVSILGLGGVIMVIAIYISYLPFAEIKFRLFNSRRLTKDEHGRVHTIFEEAYGNLVKVYGSKASSLKIKLRLIYNNEINAYALGNSTLVFTSGMLQNLTDSELKGIMAHELGHFINNDNLSDSLFNGISLFYRWSSNIVQNSNFFFTKLLSQSPFAIVFIFPILIICIPLGFCFNYLNHSIGIINNAINRLKEYKADNVAVSIGYKDELLLALHKIDDRHSSGLTNSLRSTHPSCEFRVESIKYGV